MTKEGVKYFIFLFDYAKFVTSSTESWSKFALLFLSKVNPALFLYCSVYHLENI